MSQRPTRNYDSSSNSSEYRSRLRMPSRTSYSNRDALQDSDVRFRSSSRNRPDTYRRGEINNQNRQTSRGRHSRVDQAQGTDQQRYRQHRAQNPQRTQRMQQQRPYRQKSNAYNMPSVWTKQDNMYSGSNQQRKSTSFPQTKRSQGLFSNRRNRLIFSIIIAVAIVIGADWLLTHDKIYQGVSVGNVDVSGMTVDEAALSISEAYSTKVQEKNITIYAGSALDNYDVSNLTTNQLVQIASENQNADSLKEWTTNFNELDAAIAATSLAEEAYNKGRSDGLIFVRILALIAGVQIEPRVTMSEKGVDSLAHTIDVAVGKPHVESGIQIVDGVSTPTQGEDGMEVNRDTFTAALQKAFLSEESTTPSFGVKVEYAPQKITFEKAQKVSDRVNASIMYGCVFYYQSVGWEIKAAMLGDWIDTKIEKVDNEWELLPFVSAERARSSIIAQVKEWVDQPLICIEFENNNGNIYVKTDGSFDIPQIDNAISDLSSALFDGSDAPSSAPNITINSIQAPESMSFEEAINSGVVSVISSYTTEYTNEVADQARNHNIHLMADKLNNSIAKADGGVWSFHGTAGESNKEAGFVDAGIILDGVYTEDVGGGICQAATTVFNAVYEAGYPIPVRFNHSLYIASYPAGRDAAVNWPDLDLKWTNDGSSDVLVTMSYTDTTITCTLYGVSPGYRVSTETGDWEEGEKAETKKIEDPSLEPGEEVVKQKPSDGRKITIVRTVTDGNGKVLHVDTFESTYQPKNEIIMVGPEE